MFKIEKNKIEEYLVIALFVTSMLIFLNLGNMSISMPIGGFLLLYEAVYYPYRFKLNIYTKVLLVFVLLGFISTIISPLPATMPSFYFALQTIYWYLLVVVVSNIYCVMNLYVFSRTMAISSLILGLLYIATPIPMSQNSIAFSLVVMTPLGYFGCNRNFIKVIYCLMMLVFMSLNESRSGLLILFAEFVTLYFLYSPIFRKYILIGISSIAIIATVLWSEPVRVPIGQWLRPYNDEVGALLIDPDFVLKNDKSWIIRVAQMQKGKQLFAERPMWGLGPKNFSQQFVEIDVSKIESNENEFLKRTMRSQGQRSAHNSYINLITENGLIGTVVFVVMVLLIYVYYIKNLTYFRDTFESCVFIISMGMLVYFYSISALYGTSTWLIYGLLIGVTNKIEQIQSN